MLPLPQVNAPEVRFPVTFKIPLVVILIAPQVSAPVIFILPFPVILSGSVAPKVVAEVTDKEPDEILIVLTFERATDAADKLYVPIFNVAPFNVKVPVTVIFPHTVAVTPLAIVKLE